MLRYAVKKPCYLNQMPRSPMSIPLQQLSKTSTPQLRHHTNCARLTNSYQGIRSLPNRTNNGTPTIARRAFSNKPPPPAGDKTTDAGGGETTNEIVLTPGQKVVAGTRLTMWLGVAALSITCSYYIGKELLPTKMSPNSIFDSAFSKIKADEGLKRRFGASLKAYGRDHGGKREGRRNFIENSEYTDKDDGSKRVRVRFNLEGEHGNAFVFAEVSNNMSSGEFVYLMVQDRRNGQVVNLIDNRSALMARRMAGDDAKGQDVFASLAGVRK